MASRTQASGRKARAAARSKKKIFHKIGEVCELTNTEPYVLRYWESEFPFLAPEKNSAGQRIYTEHDIQTVLAIKRLLYEEGYTTAGARRRGSAGPSRPYWGKAIAPRTWHATARRPSARARWASACARS